MESKFEHEQLLVVTPDQHTIAHRPQSTDQDGSFIRGVEAEDTLHEPAVYLRKGDDLILSLRGGLLHTRFSQTMWQLSAIIGDSVILGCLMLFLLATLHFHPIPPASEQTSNAWLLKPVVMCLAVISWSIAVRVTQGYEIHNLYDRLASPLCSLLAFSIMLISLILWYIFFASSVTYLDEMPLSVVFAAMAALCTWRVILASLMNLPRFRPQAVIVGANNAGESLARELKNAKRYTANVLGYIDVNMTGAEAAPSDDLPILGDQHTLRNLVRLGQVDMIIMAIDYKTNPGIFQEAIELAQFGISVLPMTTAYERTSGKISIEHIGDQWYIALPLEMVLSPLYLIWKKALDMIFGLVGTLVLMLLVPILAPCLYLDSPGPIFYRQERLGLNGRKFIMFKFRSMQTSAEARGRAQWASEDDRRVTRIGRLMRKTHLDELPQVWNILRGDMSLIGPRPERQEFVSTLETSIPFYRCRLSIKPGLTGWAQVKYGYARNNQDALEKLQYDLYYLKHQSFMLDIFIIIQTVIEVILHRGM